MVTEFSFTTTSLGSSIAPPVRLLELQSIPVLMRRLESGHWDGPMLEQICRLGRGAEGLTEMLRHQAGVRALVQQFPEKPAHAVMAVQALRNFLACPLEPAHRQQFVELYDSLTYSFDTSRPPPSPPPPSPPGSPPASPPPPSLPPSELPPPEVTGDVASGADVGAEAGSGSGELLSGG